MNRVPLERGGVAAERGAVEPARGELTLRLERLAAAEVEERDDAVLPEDVVAGLRIGVERAEDQVAAEDEAPQRLGVRAARSLVALGRLIESPLARTRS